MPLFSFRDVPRVQGEGIPPELDRAIRVIREAGQGLEKQLKSMAQVWMSPAVSDSDGAGMKIPGPKGKQGQRGRMGQPGRTGEIEQLPIFGQPKNLGKLVLLQAQTASSSATIDFVLNRQPNSKFFAYVVLFANVVPATDAVELWMRTSTDAGATYDAGASDYKWTRWQITDAAATGATGDTADAQIVLQGASVGNDTNEESAGHVWVMRPSAAKYCRAIWESCWTNSSGEFAKTSGAGLRATAADVDGIRFLFASGNIASGEFRLYGLLE